MRTQTIGITLFLLALSISCAHSPKEKDATEDQLPNIVLLMGDDHGWDEVGYNGHPFVQTPVLDEMAASGLRLDRFYSGHPTCSPTRGSFLTGRHPNRYGIFSPNWSLRPEEITIAHIMKKAGYSTAHFGKWHVGPVKKESPTSPGAMGFDEWLSHDNFFEMDPVLSRNGEAPQKFEGEGSEVIIDETIKFIQASNSQDQPFLAVVWFGSPHEPYSGLPEDLAHYENLPDSLAIKKVRLTSNETGERVSRPLRDVLQERYAEITAMDRAIGTLRTFLRENNLEENTLVMYCGDNGTPPSAARTGLTRREQKGSLYEGGILVPAVLEWPAVIKEPASTPVLSYTSDMLPTLAELADQPLPERPLDGISLVPFFREPEKERTEPLFFWQFEPGTVFSETPEPYIDPELQEGTTPLAKIMDGKYTRTFRNYQYQEINESDFSGERVMMRGTYKLIVEGKSPNKHGFELYDIQKDPGESENLADAMPEMVQQMNTDLHNWQESVLNSLTGADYENN
ncbi:MAG: sulfatase-like hydrolase/transferase [Bacteroidales bacterium]|nr:sulfatase-like hydrolase/transferase [Bacteroidales bacterium]MDT8432370.1 sulfatase-like hydrolase/transferase [Bacteroidales bacterium]